MVVVGGITRLTGSGLSITEWNVIMGSIPPLNQNDWSLVFEKYKASPQFQKVNFSMNLEEFKSIFWWEFIHRLIGRLIGMVFLIPFLYFLWKKRLSKSLIRQLLVIFGLGALQGFIGWYMVSSGLIDKPAVSHYRLATHLITAFITYGYIFWVALSLIYQNDPSPKVSKQWSRRTAVLLGIVILQIVYGAFVAGLHAGKVYNTWPKMGEDWFPSTILAMQPAWVNFFENYIGVQFIHRYIALALLLMGLLLAYFYRTEKAFALKQALNFFLIALVIQFVLGVVTLLYAAPIALSAIHQIGGFFLFTSVIFFYFRAKTLRQP